MYVQNELGSTSSLEKQGKSRPKSRDRGSGQRRNSNKLAEWFKARARRKSKDKLYAHDGGLFLSLLVN